RQRQLVDRVGFRPSFCHKTCTSSSEQPWVFRLRPFESWNRLARDGVLCLSAGWHVLVEKPFTLDIGDARSVAGRAAEVKRHLWAGPVYLFAPYLSVMKPYATGKAR